MKIIYKILVSSVLLLSFFSKPTGLLSASTESKPVSSTYLIVGYDDAAENTDTICLANINSDSQKINVVQIPRDTYYNFGHSQNKINQLYAYERVRGSSRDSAMAALSRSLSESLALKIDGYVGISTSAFEEIITALGGVYVDSEREMLISNRNGEHLLTLAKGENFLSPKQAMLLARHRAGYKRGDLERIDAQKMLIQGIYKTLNRGVGYKSLIGLMRSADGIVTNVSVLQMISLLRRVKGYGEAEISVKTLPGEPVTAPNGISYYVIQRESVATLLSEAFAIKKEEFDKKRTFENANIEEFSRIYNKVNLNMLKGTRASGER